VVFGEFEDHVLFEVVGSELFHLALLVEDDFATLGATALKV
jgi:hypothetical protein